MKIQDISSIDGGTGRSNLYKQLLHITHHINIKYDGREWLIYRGVLPYEIREQDLETALKKAKGVFTTLSTSGTHPSTPELPKSISTDCAIPKAG